jgi:hypothetical protein
MPQLGSAVTPAVPLLFDAGLEEATIDDVLFEGAPDTVTPTFRYQPTADGQRFLINITADEPTASPITIVTNWTAGLKK